jgi:MFS family permease
LPLSAALVENKKAQAKQFHRQSIPEALREAFTHRGYVLLCAGYSVCGFQLMFISVHFPAYLVDQHMTPQTGMTALAPIGLFNIFGRYAWGWLGGHYAKKNLLSALYFTRAVAIALFVLLPLSPLSVFVFAATIGFLWLGTVPLTNGLIAQVFGVQYLSTLGAPLSFSTRLVVAWAYGSAAICLMRWDHTASCGC